MGNMICGATNNTNKPSNLEEIIKTNPENGGFKEQILKEEVKVDEVLKEEPIKLDEIMKEEPVKSDEVLEEESIIKKEEVKEEDLKEEEPIREEEMKEEEVKEEEYVREEALDGLVGIDSSSVNDAIQVAIIEKIEEPIKKKRGRKKKEPVK